MNSYIDGSDNEHQNKPAIKGNLAREIEGAACTAQDALGTLCVAHTTGASSIDRRHRFYGRVGFALNYMVNCNTFDYVNFAYDSSTLPPDLRLAPS